jgi:hypothetical protein
MKTTLTLSRGQRNDPFPVYVHPELEAFSGYRRDSSRLGQYFKQIDPDAVVKTLSNLKELDYIDVESGNTIDNPNYGWPWAEMHNGYTIANERNTAGTLTNRIEELKREGHEERAAILQLSRERDSHQFYNLKVSEGTSQGSTTKGVKK